MLTRPTDTGRRWKIRTSPSKCYLCILTNLNIILQYSDGLKRAIWWQEQLGKADDNAWQEPGVSEDFGQLGYSLLFTLEWPGGVLKGVVQNRRNLFFSDIGPVDKNKSSFLR